jgi:isoleucyl-tRNA synthetase
MLDFKKQEQEILEFWEKNKIYEKVKKKNQKGKDFYFLQGPPYTSGKLHIGQAWNNSMKDIALRYKRMKGYNVWDRAGYDMHGLPTENRAQKELKLRDKDAIADYGVDKFIKYCLKISSETAELMNKDLLRLGIWLDYKNAYMPISEEFIEGEWWFIKQAWKQKRLYKGKKIMHWCAHCETSLAKHELEYQNVKEGSIFLKFKLKEKDNQYLIVWTTTPWTIPFNLAVMVNPTLDYVKAKVDNEIWIVAKALANVFISGLLGKKFEILEEFKGDKLQGEKYEHPFYNDLKEQYDSLNSKNIHKVILSEQYVDTSAGSGLVHCAPGCGPEDKEVGDEYGIPAYNALDEQGVFQDMGKFSGWKAKEEDEKFVQELKNKGSLIEQTHVEHEYPFCWRCHKPVVFRATEQWFLKIEDLKDRLIEFNKKVNWEPEFCKKNYDSWTENLKDNGVTRQRYWGTPMPIWECENESCYNMQVIGSVKELKEKAGKVPQNLHKPWIDSISWKCDKCNRKMRRIPDIIDVWIDSGTASWNCLNYPKTDKHMKLLPADLILEATEQIRLWFSMLQICSAIAFDKSAYENVYCHGMIYDFEGMKMSKSIGNIISPYEVIDKYSSDILRYYICETSSGENINFNWEDVKQKQRHLLVLWNLHKLLLDLKKNTKKGRQKSEEKYILSKMNSTIKAVGELFEQYKLDKTITHVENLFLDLSRVYIQLTRERAEEKIVYETLKKVYVACLKLFAPICPFITEKLWQELKKEKIVKEESVHLCSWPKKEDKNIDKKLEEEFGHVLDIIEAGLRNRAEKEIGLKWPLSKATIYYHKKINKELEDIIKNQLNVKKINWKVVNQKDFKVELDTKMTPELEREGYARVISRKVQSERKKAGLVKEDKIDLIIVADIDLNKEKKYIKQRTNAKNVEIKKEISEQEQKNYQNKTDKKIKDKEVKILFNKL